MSSVYPGAITPAGAANPGDTLAAAGHTALHNTHSDDARALATKLGTGSSTAAASTVLRGTGAGTSAWGQVVLSTDVTGVLPQGSGGTGTTTGTGTGAAVYQVSPTLNTPTFTTPSITDYTNAQHTHQNAAGAGLLDDRAVVLRNTHALQSNNFTSTPTDLISLGSDNYLRLNQIPSQAITSNSTQTNVLIQSGWNFIQGTGANTATKSITFPQAYSAAPIVVIGHLGFSNGADPLVLGDLSGQDSGNIVKIAAISTTTAGFTAGMTADSSATISSAIREGLSWFAIGPK